ncbi:MAG TPA: hypothetical protein VM536_22975, partial [Chloroflexia bacterium]|nr:hypothetical protein [Chloroflexia bacterium]
MKRMLLGILVLLAAGLFALGAYAMDAPQAPGVVGWVLDEDGNSIELLDPLSGRIIGKHDFAGVLNKPHLGAYDPAAKRLYVGNKGGNFVVFDVADPLNPRVLANLKPGGNGEIHRVVLAGGLAWLAHEGDSAVYAYDMTDLGKAPLKFGKEQGFDTTHGLTLRPGSDELWASNRPTNAPGTISRIDVRTRQVIGTPLPTTGRSGDRPNNIAFTPDGRWAYVANTGTGATEITVMDAARFVVVKQIVQERRVGLAPHALVFDPGTRRIFVVNKDSPTLTAIDADTNTIAGYFTVGAEPHGISLGPDGLVYAVAKRGKRLVAFDPRALQVRREIEDPGLVGPHSVIFTNVPLPAPAAVPGAGSRTVPETGQTVAGGFLTAWDGYGGMAGLGRPLAPAIGEPSELDGQIYTVQYFERGVLEYHPEHGGGPFAVQLAQLGTMRYRARYGPDGAPGQQARAEQARRFPATGKTVGGAFRQYWEQHGGLMRFGYPISEEFIEAGARDGGSAAVQYFERAVLVAPAAGASGGVTLLPLGADRWVARYG